MRVRFWASTALLSFSVSAHVCPGALQGSSLSTPTFEMRRATSDSRTRLTPETRTPPR